MFSLKLKEKEKNLNYLNIDYNNVTTLKKKSEFKQMDQNKVFESHIFARRLEPISLVFILSQKNILCIFGQCMTPYYLRRDLYNFSKADMAPTCNMYDFLKVDTG